MENGQNLQTIIKSPVLVTKGLKKRQKNFLTVFGDNTNITESCIAGRIDRSTFYLWLKSTVFATAIMDIREGLIDWGESLLQVEMKARNLGAIIFFLKTQGKKRGWSERFDIDLEKETKTLFQSADDKKLIAETRKKLALLDLLLVTEDPDKKLIMLEEFKK